MNLSQDSAREIDFQDWMELEALQEWREELLRRAHELAYESERHVWELTHELQDAPHFAASLPAESPGHS